jgi:2-polyprenyl-3-methyl-5-hydroxy-6-metoxy-1,4-benzoquinol methylase
MKFPITRICPLTGDAAHRVLAYLPAAVVAACNPTYRASFSKILNISPQDEFPIVESPAGFIFAGWLPPEDFLRRVYEDVIDHAKTVTQTIAYRAALLEFAAAFLTTVERYHPAPAARRLLDYGCGYGSLLRMLAGREVQAIGYEPSPARQQLTSSGGIEIFRDLDQVADAGPFDLFICTEVLEHVADPRAALRFMKKNAASGALLAMTVPDCERSYVEACLSVFANGGRLSPVFNPWEHLNYFSAENLRRLLAEEGFTVINDFGRTRTARDACAKLGDAHANPIFNSLRILRRAATTAPSTQLFCQIS